MSKAQNSQTAALEQLPEQFRYEYFEKNRYLISNEGQYEALCNNGFIKLYQQNGRVYWHTQNQFGHKTPDWKFHVSVSHEDIKKAWNAVAEIFVRMKCRAGMKTYYLSECSNPQSGREITVYILKYAEQYEDSCFAGDFGLSIADEHSEQYWLQMVKRIEQTLQQKGVQRNGLAPGDCPIGKYVSLRNQAFITASGSSESIYPPNQYGWNPLKMEEPIDIQYFRRESKGVQKTNKATKRFILWIAFPITIASIAFLASVTETKMPFYPL